MDTSPSNPLPTVQITSTMPDITRQNQLTSPLVRLPAELRNHIYTLACQNLVITAKHPTKPATQCIPLTALSLLLTCKQVRFEATPILFTHATMSVGQISSLEKMPPHLGADVCSMITSIELTTSWLRVIHNTRLYPTAGTDFRNVSKITVNDSSLALLEESMQAKLRE